MSSFTRVDFEILKEAVEAKGRLKLRVATGSMAPLIGVDEEIVVAPVRGDIRRFDILVFYSGGRLMCHYVWGINRFIGASSVLVTRGLISRAEDLPIGRKDVLGLVSSHRLGAGLRAAIVLKRLLGLYW